MMFKLVLFAIGLNGSVMSFEVNNLPSAKACEAQAEKLVSDMRAKNIEVVETRHRCEAYRKV